MRMAICASLSLLCAVVTAMADMNPEVFIATTFIIIGVGNLK